MLQLDIRVTVRNPETGEILENVTKEDLNQSLYQLEDLINGASIVLDDGRNALLTIAYIKEVK